MQRVSEAENSRDGKLPQQAPSRGGLRSAEAGGGGARRIPKAESAEWGMTKALCAGTRGGGGQWLRAGAWALGFGGESWVEARPQEEAEQGERGGGRGWGVTGRRLDSHRVLGGLEQAPMWSWVSWRSHGHGEGWLHLDLHDAS